MTAAVQAVLFDLDGTLADTEAITAAALQGAWARAGQPGPAPLDRFLAMSGQPLETILARLQLPARLAELYRQEAATLADRARLFAGALTWLTMLRTRHVPVGVITGKERSRTTVLLKRLGVTDLIGAVVTPSDPPAPKPAPDGVLWLCDQFRVDVRHTVLVGDAVADMQAGQAAGAHTIAVLWGTGRREVLAAHRPWRIVEQPAQLTVLLEDLTAGNPAAPDPPGAAQSAPSRPARPVAPLGAVHPNHQEMWHG
ncbi:HAD family hydrolase [Streptomyces sp. AV19]|uniref:HAD family hydrolase n=1 Tax=Streptomyces sp. AV19 TaxID=2793068 RepID=UPI0018FEFF94|nr:HAD family hydrolase [Streptomyces sp. AV19]MBH1938938.1 HAD family hydrolase [Streptomyces sp. AV19]MDG4536820.1 HAD family hydrolase [Streptomyces sp. AV19]